MSWDMDIITSISKWILDNIDMAIKIIASLAVIITSYAISKKFSSIMLRGVVKVSPTTLTNLSRLTRILIIFIGFLIALSILGIELSGILVAAGFTGIVVGLAAQQTLSQLFSGISLIIEGRAKIGDSIRIGDIGGVIEHIGLMSTQIRAWNGEIYTIPNNIISSSSIVNLSRSIARRADITIGISYGSDIDKAIDIIRRVLDEEELVLTEPKPMVIVEEFGESSINLRVMFWTPSQYFLTMRSEVIKKIKKQLEEAGIEIPYPQRVVWIKNIQQ